MYRVLLVPLDGSVFAEHALATAAAIAKRTKATILLARVHLPIGYGELAGVEQWERDTRRDETEYLVRVAAGLEREHGVTVRTVLLNEPVTAALCERARDEHADLIVMCTHGHTGFSRAWLGSVADGVARNAAVPVLMLRPRDPQATARIEVPERLFGSAVIPLDGSPLAEAVLEPAAALATVMDSAVTLLRVVEPVVARSVDYPLPYPLPLGVVDREGTEAAMSSADTYLAEIVHRMRTAHPRLVVSCRVERADRAAATILDVAKQTGAGLVAMATHGRGMSRLLVGSVADKVLRGSDAAVLLFRPTQN
jgi:nucleotide-binding universal stress UspA family protein